MRKDRPQCGLLIENSEGKVLLQLRDDNPAIPYPGCRGTFGGQVESGETPEEAVRREVRNIPCAFNCRDIVVAYFAMHH